MMLQLLHELEAYLAATGEGRADRRAERSSRRKALYCTQDWCKNLPGTH